MEREFIRKEAGGGAENASGKSCSSAYTGSGAHEEERRTGLWKWRAMENEENQKQVFHRFPQPLEIAKGAISTFPQPARLGSPIQKGKHKKRRTVEKWKSKSRIPTFPRPEEENKKGGTRLNAG